MPTALPRVALHGLVALFLLGAVSCGDVSPAGATRLVDLVGDPTRFRVQSALDLAKPSLLIEAGGKPARQAPFAWRHAGDWVLPLVVNVDEVSQGQHWSVELAALPLGGVAPLQVELTLGRRSWRRTSVCSP